MRNIKILMHTHWDREWYFTKDETQALLRNHMFEVIEFLEKNRDVIYVLDGQSVMIDDFLEVAPKWRERMKALVEKNQLRVGPWYTQTDLLLVHGESIIRNLYYGMKKALEYGSVMKVGYAPDTFGHSSQMPQIYKLFGIESSFFWRGYSELKGSKSDFLWKGIDGSIIFGINLATGYQGAKYLESNKDELKERMNKILKVLDHYSAADSRLIMNGHDQMPIQKNIFEIIEKIKEIYPEDSVEISDFEGYVDTLRDKKLEIVDGELIHSKHSRIHKTITSTRMDIKLLNTDLEYKLYNILEPLSILATELGYDYPHEMMEKCYKILFGAHAHDSIGGCNSDSVNKDIKQRLTQVKEIVDTQIELYMRLISMGADSNEKNILTLYNFLPERRENEYVEVEMYTRSSDFKIYDGNQEIHYLVLNQEIVDAGLIDRQIAARLLDIKIFKTKISLKISEIKGLSIKYLTYTEGEGIFSENNNHLIQNRIVAQKIENEFYEVEIKDDKITLLDKIKGKHFDSILSIESSGDAGDSYDYSPPVKDMIIDEKFAFIQNIIIQKNLEEERVSFKINYKLPKDAQSREKEYLDTEMDFYIELSLKSKNELLGIKIRCENSVKDSRFRLVFNPEIFSERVESDSHLCVVDKPIYHHKELSIWEKDKWSEKPVSIETYNSYVALEESQREGVIYTYGLKEYEVKDGKIFITLYRAFSHLGKRELVNRPGRPSGIEIPTPDNQLQGEVFEFKAAISLVKGKKNRSKIAKQFLTPIMGYQLKEFNRFNLNTPSCIKKIERSLELDLQEAVVSALKLNESSNDLFIRVFNPTNSKITLNFNKEIYLSNMFEEKGGKVTEYEMRGQEILNLIIGR